MEMFQFVQYVQYKCGCSFVGLRSVSLVSLAWSGCRPVSMTTKASDLVHTEPFHQNWFDWLTCLVAGVQKGSWKCLHHEMLKKQWVILPGVYARASNKSDTAGKSLNVLAAIYRWI